MSAALVKILTKIFFIHDGIKRLQSWLMEHSEDCPVVKEDDRFGPPVHRPGKIVCIGLNYRDHAAESNMNLPQEPIIFFKATSSLVGPE